VCPLFGKGTTLCSSLFEGEIPFVCVVYNAAVTIGVTQRDQLLYVYLTEVSMTVWYMMFT
jgi:hypothetical protein